MLKRALLICSLGMITLTPVFADYHLTILLLPLLVAAYWEQHAGPCGDVLLDRISLPFVDSLTVIILLIPKSFPLLPLNITAQTFINPFLILAYIIWVFLPRLAKPGARPSLILKQ